MSQVVVDGERISIPREEYLSICREALKKNTTIEEIAGAKFSKKKAPVKKKAAVDKEG